MRLVDRAMAEGVDVVTTDIWWRSGEGSVDSHATVAGPARPQVVRVALLERHVGSPIGTVASWTDLYGLGRRAADHPNS